MMKRAEFLRLMVAAGLSPAAALGRTSEASAQPIRRVRSPCSVGRICRELSRRFGAGIYAEPALSELRVVWAFAGDLSLETTLTRLAELTDARLRVLPSQTRRRRFALERKHETTQREAAWRFASLSRMLQELLRAADQYEHGTLDVTSYSPNVRTYLDIGRASQLKYLRFLTPERVQRLLQGDEIHLPPGTVPDVEIQGIVAERYAHHGPDQPPDRTRKFMDEEIERTRRYGMGLQIDFNRRGPFVHLMLNLGGRPANVLCRFGPDELGLPLTRTRPYDLLEARAAETATPVIPAALQKRLEEEVVLGAGGGWEEALLEFARVAGVEVISDAYLCRIQSRIDAHLAQKVTVAPKGTTIAGALDGMCRHYEYLWWEKDGCVYLRARAWPWDADYELPDSFLDGWTAAVGHRQALGTREIGAMASLTPLQLNGLASLGGTVFSGSFGPERPVFQQFLRFFRRRPLAEQARLLGPGLIVRPEEAADLDLLIRPLVADTPPLPLTLRLTHSLILDEKASPPVYQIQMRLLRSWSETKGAAERWPERGDSEEFTVRVPRPSNPFDPT